MVRQALRSWIREAALAVVIPAMAGCQAPPPSAAPPAVVPAPPPESPCGAAREHLAEMQRDLAAGRLLHVLAHKAADAGCPEEQKQAAATYLSAVASLGDAATAARWAEHDAVPRLFDPDGPVTPLASEADARDAYSRAVAAYEAGDWVAASNLALPVGAGGGPLAGEGFVLAARSAERRGDGPRAARMWARAHRAACSAKPRACAPHWPDDDLFGITARYGRYVSWYSSDLCAGTGRTIVGGTWQVTRRANGLDIHEVPSRVLLEHVDTGEASPVCFSRDGKRRVGVLHDYAHNKEIVLSGAHGGPLTRSPAAGPFSFDARQTYVLDNGGAVFNEGSVFWVLDTSSRKVRRVTASPGTYAAIARTGELGWIAGSLGEHGYLYTYFPEPPPPKRAPKAGVMRHDVETGKGTIVYEGDLGGYHRMGPADDKGRFLAYDGGHLRWIDGAAGKVLAEMKTPDGIAHDLAERLGVVAPSSVVWIGHGATPGTPHGLYTANVVTGVVERGGLAWHPIGDDTPSKLAEVTRVLGNLPAGPSAKTWSAFSGWKVAWVEGSVVKVDFRNEKRGLRVVLAADRKGAMVIGPDRLHFELVGEVPDAFRASAWCGNEQRDEPGPDDRAWPLEVCGAAFEEPGLTEALLRTADDAAAP